MPSIQFYAHENDLLRIIAKLNADEHIAFIVSHGPRKWIARREVDSLKDGAYYLWHIPSGPLPLLTVDTSSQVAIIHNPFEGWTEQCSGAECGTPFFGSIPSIVRFGVLPTGKESRNSIGQSYFGWTGSRYSSLGKPASKMMQKWWRDLARWVAITAVKKITRWGPFDGPGADIWAFPCAYEAIVSGRHRDANPAL
jgi:hypothetical protein